MDDIYRRTPRRRATLPKPPVPRSVPVPGWSTPRVAYSTDRASQGARFCRCSVVSMSGLLGTTIGGGSFFPDPDEQGRMLRVVPRGVVVRKRPLLGFGQQCDGTSWPLPAPQIVVTQQAGNGLSCKANLLVERSRRCERVQRPYDLPESDVVALQVAADQIGEPIDRGQLSVRGHPHRMPECALFCRRLGVRVTKSGRSGGLRKSCSGLLDQMRVVETERLRNDALKQRRQVPQRDLLALVLRLTDLVGLPAVQHLEQHECLIRGKGDGHIVGRGHDHILSGSRTLLLLLRVRAEVAAHSRVALGGGGPPPSGGLTRVVSESETARPCDGVVKWSSAPAGLAADKEPRTDRELVRRQLHVDSHGVSRTAHEPLANLEGDSG